MRIKSAFNLMLIVIIYFWPIILSGIIVDNINKRHWEGVAYLEFVGLSIGFYLIYFLIFTQVKKASAKTDNKISNDGAMSFYDADTQKTISVKTPSIMPIRLKSGQPAAKVINPDTGKEIVKIISERDFIALAQLSKQTPAKND